MAYAKTLKAAWCVTLGLDMEDPTDEEMVDAVNTKLSDVGLNSEENMALSTAKKVELITSSTPPVISKQDVEETEVSTDESSAGTSTADIIGQVADEVRASTDEKNATVAPAVPTLAVTEKTTVEEESGTTKQAFSELKVEEPVKQKSGKATARKPLRGKRVEGPFVSAVNGGQEYDKEKETLCLVLKNMGQVRIGKYNMYLQASNVPVGIPSKVVGQLVAKGKVSRYE